MKKKILIPTVTSSFKKYPLHLFSPRYGKKFNFADELTVIDCHTFYLRKFLRDLSKSINHYNYYIDFCSEYQYDHSKILILPDWDWMLNEVEISKLNEKWQLNIFSKNILATHSSLLKNDFEYIGFAGLKHDDNHLKWRHIFSKHNLDLNCELLTFDSQDHEKFSERDNIAAKTFIQSLF